MEEAIYEILATPPKIDKGPENSATEEEEANTATATAKERPTRIDPTDAMQSSQEQSPPEATHPDKVDDGSYMPTPDARQSPHFETASDKTQKKMTTWGKS